MRRNQSLKGRLLGCLIAIISVVCAEGKPQIQTPPSDNLGVLPGESVTFSVDAVGSSPLRYQWRLNGVNIPEAISNLLVIANVQLTNSGRYSVAVSDDSGTRSSRPARLTVKIPVIIGPQDNFSDAYELSTDAGALRTYNTNATRELNEPVHAGYGGGHSLWFKMHPVVGGIMTLNTAGSDFDTVIAVYTGRSVDQLTPLGIDVENDDAGGYLTSRTAFNLPALLDPLENYYIAVDGFAMATGEIALTWRLEITLDQLPRITNRPGRRTVPLGSDLDLTVGYDGLGALGTWIFNQGETPVRDSVFSLKGFDETKVGLYSVKIASPSGRAVFTKPANIQVNIQNGGGADTNSFSFDKFPETARAANLRKQLLAVQQSTRPTLQSWHPRPMGGGPASGYTSTQIFSTIYSSKEPGEPDHAGEAGGASEWFSFQPTNNATLNINTDGSSYDTVLAVYTGPGDSFETLTETASDNNSGLDGRDSKVVFAAVANTIYYIAVDGVGGARGVVRLNLNFGDPPVITNALSSQAVPPGSNATFRVVANGSAAMSYRWRYAGASISGATNPTLTVLNVDAGKTGVYSVTISNLVGIVSDSAELSIGQPPSITNNTPRVTALVGSNLEVGMSISGTGPFQYDWQCGGVSRGTNSTLPMTNVQPAQSGDYYLIARNAFGVTTSSVPVSLTVQFPPVINSQPGSRTLAVSAPLTLTVLASGDPALSFQWLRNGAALSDGGTVSGANSAMLSISSFQASDAGYYQVRVANALGETNSTMASIQLASPLRIGGYLLGANGTFQVQLIGPAETFYELETSTNLTDWASLGTNYSAAGFITFQDADATNHLHRFYRTKILP